MWWVREGIIVIIYDVASFYHFPAGDEGNKYWFQGLSYEIYYPIIFGLLLLVICFLVCTIVGCTCCCTMCYR